jgi:hypothetical protein
MREDEPPGMKKKSAKIEGLPQFLIECEIPVDPVASDRMSPVG